MPDGEWMATRRDATRRRAAGFVVLTGHVRLQIATAIASYGVNGPRDLAAAGR